MRLNRSQKIHAFLMVGLAFVVGIFSGPAFSDAAKHYDLSISGSSQPPCARVELWHQPPGDAYGGGIRYMASDPEPGADGISSPCGSSATFSAAAGSCYDFAGRAAMFRPTSFVGTPTGLGMYVFNATSLADHGPTGRAGWSDALVGVTYDTTPTNAFIDRAPLHFCAPQDGSYRLVVRLCSYYVTPDTYQNEFLGHACNGAASAYDVNSDPGSWGGWHADPRMTVNGQSPTPAPMV